MMKYRKSSTAIASKSAGEERCNDFDLREKHVEIEAATRRKLDRFSVVRQMLLTKGYVNGVFFASNLNSDFGKFALSGPLPQRVMALKRIILASTYYNRAFVKHRPLARSLVH